ncbi:MAG: PAS domain-containing sensor histidine kinase [Janthinobacterium lividum]
MSLVVRIVAPIGRDAAMLVDALTQAGIAAEGCKNLQTFLHDRSDERLGPLLVTEESLTPTLIGFLSGYLASQASWSDLPVLILTTSGRETERTRRMEHDWQALRSPVLLERPIRMATLISSVRAAVRARGRQYEVRSALDALDKAAAQLRAEQDALRAVVDNMPVGILLAKASGEVVLGNRMIEQILRHPTWPAQDVESYSRWVSFHEDGRQVQGAEYPLARAMKTGLAISAEDYLYQRGDGSKAWVRLSAAPILDDAGLVTGGVVAVTDVDEEKRAAKILRRSEERFRLLIEQASVGIAIGDLNGGLSYMNPTLLGLLGYTQHDLQAGRIRLDDLTPAEYAEADARAVEQLRTGGTAEAYQKAYLASDGTEVPLLVGAVCIPSSSTSDREEVAVFITDLRSQKKAEAALIQSEKLAAVGRLAASISHEINNPLESVTNLLYLAAGEQVSDSVRSYLDMAAQELARVSQIAGQTLRFHRQSTRPRSVSPQELLEPVLALYQGRMVNAIVTLQTEYRGEPRFSCYEGDIRQVLNNLVGNAIDAMRGKGVLRVRSHASINWRTGAPGVRIVVADEGHGMTPETLRRLFEPFYTTKGIHGTGLGLWISHGIVAKHHGSLTIRSHIAGRDGIERGGTVFSLFLPLQPDIPEVDVAAPALS